MSTCQPSDERSYTDKYQRHTACSFGDKVVCHYDKEYSKEVVIFRGRDPAGEFIKCMFREVQNCRKVIGENFNKPLKMKKRDKKEFQKSTLRHICERKIKPDDDDPNKKNLSEITAILLVNIVVLRV